jgi:type I restriction enzyme, S subunit
MLSRGEMQARHDPYHYLPRFLRLEARVAKRSGGKLRDYVRAISGGATPKAEEHDKYYADSTTGVPFVRVQNLSISGQLQLEDVKYINQETHHGMLARSQVTEDDLLVKITGVGRMAVASVPSPGFEGNINQHIARIRTGSRQTSAVLAAWLNTDVAEALAKRRSTGGTRPALDYGALRSMPVIFNDQTHTMMRVVYEQYQGALAQASAVLAGVDDYLLGELGINLPKAAVNTIASRIFKTQRRDLSGWRFDPQALHPEREAAIKEVKQLNARPLKSAVAFCKTLVDEVPEGAVYVGLENIESATGRYVQSSEKETVSSAFLFRKGEVLFPKLRPYLNKVFLAPFDGVCSTEFHVLHGVSVTSAFLALFLKSQIVVRQTKHLMSGNTLPRLQTRDIEGILIPDVDSALQEKIVHEAMLRMEEAERLRYQAEAELAVATRRIEAMLLVDPT